MAVSTSIVHKLNEIPGEMGVGADVNILETHASPKYAIGTRFTRGDGAKFAYCHFGADVSLPGLLVAQDFSESGTARVDGLITAPSSATTPPNETLSPGTIGSRWAQVVGGGATAHLFSGGYLVVNSGAGQGLTMPIKDNTAAGTPATGQFYMEFFDQLPVTLDDSSDVFIVGNKYANLESASAATDCIVAGATCQSMTDVSTNPYGWVQINGLVGLWTDSSMPALNDSVMLSANHNGYISVAEVSASGARSLTGTVVGYCAGAGSGGEVSLCQLNLV